MAWTAPRTWVSAEVPTAAIMNAHIRDNLLVQDAVGVANVGDMAYAANPNDMTAHFGVADPGAYVSNISSVIGTRKASYNLGSSKYSAAAVGGYVDLDTLDDLDGVNVAVLVSTGTQALVFYGARYAGHLGIGQSCLLSYRVSGASTVNASNNWGCAQESDPVGKFAPMFRVNYHTGLTAGENTFTLQMQSSAGTGGALLSYPWIMVKAL